MDPSPFGTLVPDRFRDLAEQVHRADVLVRDQAPEGIHDLRVAMRRTRSLLRTFRPMLPDDSVTEGDRLRGELRWAAGEVSAVRDLEVVHERLQDPGSATASALARLDAHREKAGATAARQVESLLATDRYATLLGDLDSFVRHATWSGLPEETAQKLLRKDWRRLARRIALVDEAAGDEAREAALHEVRKAAKRLRYAAEALAPGLGGPAEELAARAELVQDALGTHRDTLLTRDLLRRLAADAESSGDGECTASLEQLQAQEADLGEEALARYDDVRPLLERPRRGGSGRWGSPVEWAADPLADPGRG